MPASIDPASRAAAILETSCRIFSEKGVLGLRISGIAEEVGISVGTFYAHFKSKEDLLMAIKDDCLRQRLQCFCEVVQITDLNAAEKIVLAVLRSFLLSYQRPSLYAIEQVVMSPSVWEESSEDAKKALNDKHLQISKVVHAELECAIAQGHCRTRGDHAEHLEHMVIGLWTIGAGSRQVAHLRHSTGMEARSARGFPKGFLTTIQAFMIGSGWTSDDPDGDIKRLAEMALSMEVAAH